MNPEEIRSKLSMAAEQGWRVTLQVTENIEYNSVFITAVDENEKAIVVEKVGERHLPPSIVFLKDVLNVDLDWS